MATDERHTGTSDEHYDLVSTPDHALQGAETCATCLHDAEPAVDQDLVRSFREVQGTSRQQGDRSEGFLRQ